MHIKKTEYVVFDVETTGFYPTEGDRIVEIAAVRVRDGKIVDTFESFINPKRPIPPEAQKIHKITDAVVADSPSSDAVLPQLITFIGGACLVGHNIRFDLDFICYELSLCNRKLNDKTPAIDTLKMARRFMPHIMSHRLSSVAQSFGITIGETHRALADVELTASILSALLDIASKQGIVAFQDLYNEFSVPKPNFQIAEVNQQFLF